MARTSIRLDEATEARLERLLTSGDYDSASAAIRASLEAEELRRGVFRRVVAHVVRDLAAEMADEDGDPSSLISQLARLLGSHPAAEGIADALKELRR